METVIKRDFFGREEELEALDRLRKKNSSSLVCVLGRRRIGKSRLIEKFGESFKSYTTIQGLGPEQDQSNTAQLKHFATALSIRFNIRQKGFQDWTEAFYELAELTKKGEQLILLDEISWMGKSDPLFPAKLKDAWDLYFKKNPRLILTACGSVSSWIEDNILLNTNFEGRVSLSINLQELPLPIINRIWSRKSYQFSALEKMLILSVTGGVPKYLEEILLSEHAERNIIELCFKPGGLLFNDFDRIFSDIFDRRKASLKKIVTCSIERKHSLTTLAKKLGKTPDGSLSTLVHILELSGFVSRDCVFKPDGSASGLSQIRVKDNYLRFYLKHIEPNKERILKGGFKLRSLYELKGFDAILGYQFENIILANRELIYQHLSLAPSSIISAAPYWQRKTLKNKGACQVDLLIHSSLDVYFVCEFKCQKVIDRRVIGAVKRKLETIALPKKTAAKPVLVYQGEIDPAHESELREFFLKLISFEELLV
jgi:AAA+ ATPase superfamily predicted ATPase